MDVPDNGCRGNSTEKFMVCGHRLKFGNLHQKFTNPHEIFTCSNTFPLCNVSMLPSRLKYFFFLPLTCQQQSTTQCILGSCNFYFFFCSFVFEGSYFCSSFQSYKLFSCGSCITSKHSNLRVTSVVPQKEDFSYTSNHTYIAQFCGRYLNK